MARWMTLLAAGLLSVPAAAAPAAELWSYWDTSDEQSVRRIDHAPWQALLDAYLIRSDGRTLFRYTAARARDRSTVDGYIDGLAAVDPRTLSRAEQFPYWVNLYNALTVRVVLDHPGKDSIRQMGGFFRSGPWRIKLLEIAGQRLSLDDIEHRILRPIWQDHRIHYVVNCASLGCPDLLPRALTGDNAEALLQEAGGGFLAHPRAVEFNGERLRLSSLFDWYRDDFADSRDGLLRYLARQRPDLAEALNGYRGSIDYRYDWRLNAAD